MAANRFVLMKVVGWAMPFHSTEDPCRTPCR